MNAEKKGSILIVALLIASIFGFVVASFLRSSIQELKIAESNYFSRQIKDIAIAGAEVAVLSLNKNDWTGWNVFGPWSIKTLTSIDIGNSNTAQTTLMVLDQLPAPRVYSIASINLNNGKTIKKNLMVDLRLRSQFPNAITASNDIIFTNKGTVSVDSYNSSEGNYDPFFNRNDNGKLVGRNVNAKNKSAAEIYGYISTWKKSPNVGKKGKIYGTDTPSEQKINDSRIAQGFQPFFPEVKPLEDSTTIKLPSSPLIKLGTGSNLEKYHIADDLEIDKNQALHINGNVALVIDNDLTVDGLLQINEPNGKLTLYIGDDLSIEGSGIVNKSQDPHNVIIYSTGSENKKIDYYLGGQSAIYAGIYAPKARVELEKKREMFGALLAKKLVFKGDYNFHFDENLEDITGDDPSYTADYWMFY